MKYLGIDLGTSGVKVLLVDEQRNVVGKAAATYSLQTPRAGWAEAEQRRWWSAGWGTATDWASPFRLLRRFTWVRGSC